MNKYGFPVGRVWFSKMGSTALIRRKQIEAAKNIIGTELTIELIKQKFLNQIRFLKKLMHSRPRKEELFINSIKTIESSLNSLEIKGQYIDDIRTHLMGLEGTAGRAYFQSLSKIMPEKYRFNSRSRRPAKDAFNAVLNYCNGVLYSLVEKACIIAGLDPYVGFMHTDNYNKKSLVFDLIEPFRIFSEQTTVYLSTGKKIKEQLFDFKEISVFLNDKGKPVVIDAITKYLEETVRYRRRNVKRKYILNYEAHRLANILLADLADEDQKRVDWLEVKEF